MNDWDINETRRFDVAAEMLSSQEWTAIRLLTNNPDKVYDLEKEGIEVREVVAIEMAPNEHNAEYLSAKAKEVKHVHRA